MIKKILLIAVGILVLFSVLSVVMGDEEQICGGNYVLLKLKYVVDGFEVLDKSIEEGCYSKFNYKEADDVSYKLVKDENEFYEGSFNPALVFTDGGLGEEIEGEVVEVESGEFFLNVPYIKEVDDIEIYKGGEVKLKETIYNAGAASCRIDG